MTDLQSLIERKMAWLREQPNDGAVVEDAGTYLYIITALEQMQRDLEQRDELLIKAEKFRFSADVTVESRGPSQWAVCNCGEVMNLDGQWEFEPFPSNRSEDFIARTRFTFADAVIRARSALSPKEAEE